MTEKLLLLISTNRTLLLITDPEKLRNAHYQNRCAIQPFPPQFELRDEAEADEKSQEEADEKGHF
jgi:hypothetical protein